MYSKLFPPEAFSLRLISIRRTNSYLATYAGNKKPQQQSRGEAKMAFQPQQQQQQQQQQPTVIINEYSNCNLTWVSDLNFTFTFSHPPDFGNQPLPGGLSGSPQSQQANQPNPPTNGTSRARAAPGLASQSPNQAPEQTPSTSNFASNAVNKDVKPYSNSDVIQVLTAIWAALASPQQHNTKTPNGSWDDDVPMPDAF